MSEQKPVLPSRPSPPPRPQKPAVTVLPEDDPQPEVIESNIDQDTVYQNEQPLQEQTVRVQNDKPVQPKKKKNIKIYLAVIIPVCFFLIFVLSVSVGVGVFFGVNEINKNKQLELTNSSLQVLELTDKIYLKAAENQCNNYVFEITENQNKFIVKSKSSLFEIGDYLQAGKNYTFRFYIEGETEKSRSKPSETAIYFATKKLETPYISLSQDGNSINWEKIDDACGYYIYYFNHSTNQAESFYYESEDDIISYMPNLSPGSYAIQIVATSDANGYAKSDLSNYIVYSSLEKESAPIDVNVDRNNSEVTILMDNNQIKPVFVIKIGNKIYNYVTTEIKNSYTISFKAILGQIELGQSVSVYVQARASGYLNSTTITE